MAVSAIGTIWLRLLLPLLPLLLSAPTAAAQRRLSEDEMKSIINLPQLQNFNRERHVCQYLQKPADAYSGRVGGGSGGTDQFYLECCAGRPFPICGGQTASFQSACCPGFTSFESVNGRSSNCSQRVLADRELGDWLAELPASRVARFSDAFANSPQLEGVLATGRANNKTWTLLALLDDAFDETDFLAFTSCTNGTLSKNVRRKAADGRAGMGAAPKRKIAEGSRGHRALIYRQKCRELEASNATGSLDFRLEAWKHLIPGRKYISDLQSETAVPSMFKMDSGDFYPIKFSQYSNGVICVECAPIVEANHEAGNAVVHFIGKSILSRSPATSLGDLLQTRFADFWSLMPEAERRQLQQSGCDAFYTVLVPKRLDSLRALGGEQRTAALREHIVKGLWCTAGMIDSLTQPVATASTESVKFACGPNSARQVAFGPNYSRRATVSSEPGEFDVMTDNGVLHVVDAPILPRDAVSLQTALQLDEEIQPPSSEFSAAVFQTKNLSARLVRECYLNFREDEGYIVLLPTDEAFSKFFAQQGVPEAADFHASADSRCSLLRHHVLVAGRGLTSLGRATHIQRTYLSLAGDLVADYLFVKSGVPKAFFMNAEVLHDTEGHAFKNGHVYHVDEVLVPSGSSVWARMIDDMFSEQKRVIKRFEFLSRSFSDRLSTLFLPANGHHALINLDTLKSHVSDSVFYLAYLTEDGQSVDLTSLAGAAITVSREAGQYFAATAGLAAGLRRKVPLRHCGVRLAGGIICSIEEPLLAPASRELGGRP